LFVVAVLQNQVNIDLSETVIRQMKQRNEKKRPGETDKKDSQNNRITDL
jgi:hypothetical protein